MDDACLLIINKPISLLKTGMAIVVFHKAAFNMNKDNLIHKSVVDKSMGMCNRTFNKYWNEVVNLGYLVKTPTIKTWMVNPKYFRYEGVNGISLDKKWKDLHE